MNKTRVSALAVLVVALVVLFAFSVYYLPSYFAPGNGNQAAVVSKFRNGTANGLRLGLQVTPRGNGSYTIDVQENNTMAGDHPVQAADGWGYPRASLDPFDGCGSYSSFPIGLAIFQGHYTFANYSQAKALILYNTTYAFSCTTQLYPVIEFVFIANGYKASLVDSQSHVAGVENMTIHLSVTGYWTGGGGTSQPATLYTFRGDYTVLAADEWGAVELTYFTVKL